ncbi:hypothetical protein [Criblamydia sequanensis]|uniref:hypothetical protein n=1 Tax=Candidatus Criblamydia sequanensis TaxID=340071 RepID=UPI0005961403|nr:hypothetical protein [Criblamydia sequanensis]
MFFSFIYWLKKGNCHKLGYSKKFVLLKERSQAFAKEVAATPKNLQTILDSFGKIREFAARANPKQPGKIHNSFLKPFLD